MNSCTEKSGVRRKGGEEKREDGRERNLQDIFEALYFLCKSGEVGVSKIDFYFYLHFLIQI